MEIIDIEIKKASSLIYWLVNGYDIHCIPTYLWKHVTVEWVIKHYNVEINYFI